MAPARGFHEVHVRLRHIVGVFGFGDEDPLLVTLVVPHEPLGGGLPGHAVFGEHLPCPELRTLGPFGDDFINCALVRLSHLGVSRKAPRNGDDAQQADHQRVS
jgi:hypothetical protein